MTTIDLDGVRKEYGATTALDVDDLHVREGEFFTLLGPSGCGKTTTLRLLAGFESPTTGTVAIGGEDQAGVPPEARDVGVVFQNYALFPHMSVAENVAYGLRFADPPGDVDRDERVRELLDLVDLPGAGDRDPETLSGGQQQRVALARALAPGPRLLLLDEPMSALDARLRERLRVQVKAIQSDLGITTVYVTHDQEEALAISDRVAVLHDGRMEQVGPPRAVYREPATRFVAEFVGDNNVFHGEVVAVDDRVGDVAAHDEEASTGSSPASATTPGTVTVAVEDGSGTPTEFHVAADGLGIGDDVTFCVRPEQLRVAAGTNRLSVAVESAEFLGEATRYHCRWPVDADGGQEVLLRSQASVGDDDGTGTSNGDDDGTGSTDGDERVVEVGFDPEDAHVIG